MFGLMRHAPRVPYCGVCKTLGALYGQCSRVVLNHDTVFLAELLLEQTGEPEWLPAYRSFNCLALPRRTDPMPIALEYVAAITVALAHFQIEDHVADTGRLGWKALARWLSPTYRKAAARLQEWQFPLDKVAGILGTQTGREANPKSLAHVAEPTVTATALAFGHGARICGRPDLADAMFETGAKFGHLIYVLDAYQDRERDAKTGAFNGALAFPHVDARQEILTTADEIAARLSPRLANRLRGNVEERLGVRLPLLHVCSRNNLRERLRNAFAFAQSLREREHAGVVKGAAMLASVSFLAFMFPGYARKTDSWRQCLELPLNLMALGTVFALASQPPPAPGPMRNRPGMSPGNIGPNCNCRSACKDACGECCCESCCDSCCGSCCESCG